MASRVENIIKDVRRTLADPRGERWTDEDLLALLNEALIDFTQQTRILKSRVDIPIGVDDAFITLPEDCWQLTRVQYNNEPLPLVAHSDLDNLYDHQYRGLFRPGSNWMEHIGSPRALVFDFRESREARIYPRPDKHLNEITVDFDGSTQETIENIDQYGVTTLSKLGNFQDTVGTIDTDVVVHFNDLFGIMVESPLFRIPEIAEGLPGELLGVEEWGTSSRFTRGHTEIFGVASGISEGYMQGIFGTIVEARTAHEGPFGVVGGLDGILDNPYGVTSSVSYISSAPEGLFGVVANIASTTDVIIMEDIFGIVSDVYTESDHEGLYGIIDLIADDFVMSSKYGLVDDIEHPEITTEIDSKYGIVGSIVENFSDLTLYYTRQPQRIEDLTANIDTPPMYDIALKYYVSGQAFLLDIDTGSQQRASVQLQVYDRHVKTAKKDSMTDWTRGSQFETHYRRVI